MMAPGAAVMFAIDNSNGRTLLASPPRKITALKSGDGAINTLRITVKGNNATFYAK